MKVLITLVSLCFVAISYANEHIEYGFPTSQLILERNAYTVSYDKVKRIPNWVAYTIKPDFLNNPKRKSRFKSFKADPDISNPVVQKDYTHSGYARGHLAPWAISGGDRDGDGLYALLDKSNSQADVDEEKTIFEINYMSNIAPQNQRCFNGAGGVWYKLESYLQNKIVDNQQRTVSVYAGSIFYPNEPIETLGPESDIAIPHAFYKLILEKQANGELTALPFLFPHYTENLDKKTCQFPDVKFYDREHLVTVDELEVATGLDFFGQLDDQEESVLEAASSLDVWNQYYGID